MEKVTPPKRGRVGDGTPGPGRPKGVPNKTTTQLKEALLEAATLAGGEAGLVGYLVQQAADNPASFLTLLGKVLPLQVAQDPENPWQPVTVIERQIVQTVRSQDT